MRGHRLDRVVVRRVRLDDDAPADMAALLSYAEATSATLAGLSLEILEARDEASRQAGHHVGLAWALTGLLRAIPFHAAARRVYLPATLSRDSGVDFKELKLRTSTNFCIGATIDLARGIEREARLSRRKIEAGAQFFISQPTFDPGGPQAFLERYRSSYDEEFPCPIFHGVQVMTEDSLVFGHVPEWVTEDLKKERSGVDIALQVLDEFAGAGLTSIYLIPPIMRGGRRDYEAAQAVLINFRD
ncbi:MAG: squalene/phytoene synthase family protein [Chloroflexi bacterium]|nr:squalene/phytoene synthase family protein [Chloroflexota bacterium]